MIGAPRSWHGECFKRTRTKDRTIQVKTNNASEFETFTDDQLLHIDGGYSWGDLGNDAKNLGKAVANGGVNTLNLLHDHPIEAGKFGKFTIGGNRIEKPFHDDPLSKVGTGKP
jgi:hypothetical protein